MPLLVSFSSGQGWSFHETPEGLLHLNLQAVLQGMPRPAVVAAFYGLASLCFPGMAYFVGPFYVTINHMIAFAPRGPAERSDWLYSVSAAFNLLDRACEASRLHSAAA